MNLNISTNLNNNEDSRYKKNNLRNNKVPQNINFQGSFQKIINGAYDVTYTNITGIQEGVDKILGDGFFTTTIQKTNLDVKDGNIRFKDKSFLGELVNAVTYPFYRLHLDVANSILNGISKISFLEDAAQSAKKFGPLARRAVQVEQERSYECAKALLDKLSVESCIVNVAEKTADSPLKTAYNLEDALRLFSDTAATGIVDLAKNYSTRDERTLNRIATSIVSALYSARDFYNISMLQKDDSKEARKAERGRLRQELTRMALSAATTFVSLGVFGKYTKGNVALNAIVIALSALVAEIGSRILSKTPLVPLSPQRAKQISEKRNLEQAASSNTSDATNTNTTTAANNKTKNNSSNDSSSVKTLPNQNGGIALNFNGKTFSQKELFNDFLKNTKIMSTFDVFLDKNISKDEAESVQTQDKLPAKKGHTKAVILSLFGLTSAFFLAKKGLGGEYKQKLAHRQIVFDYADSINSYLNDKAATGSEGFFKAIENAKIARQKTFVSKIDRSASDFVDNLKYKQVSITAQEIAERTEELQKLPETNNLAIMNDFVRQARQIEQGMEKGEEPISIYIKRELVAGIYSGLEKLTKTLYQIFSIPAEIFDIILNKVMFEKSEQVISDIQKKTIGRNSTITTRTRKGLSQYAQLIFDNHPKGREFDTFTRKFRKKKTDKQIIDAIKTNTRNFEIGAETGALANLSRTMVTIITSYFFINDYRNKVLIESKGKDIEGANEEGRERVAHKASNFIVNGTLMNLFNSVFKRPLNASLLGAATIAAATEMTNEFMVRKSICQPVRHMKSRQAIIDYEAKQESREGIAGMWSRAFRKITGKKSLSEKIESEKK